VVVIDKAKSAIAKLKNKSMRTGKSMQLYLQLLCQEEFLRKVSLSEFKSQLVLKGGLFIYTLTNFEGRSTIDMDVLLRNLDNSEENIQKITQNILSIETGNDFISYEVVGYERIAMERKYSGISVHLIGKIGNTKTPIYVDFGVGDVIVPDSELRMIRSQLEAFDEVEINTYSIDSTIAEKFDAIIQRYELTSRMKDFYDITYLARMFEFDGTQLFQAISETLKNRGTSYDCDSFERIMNLKNNAVIKNRWQSFLRKQKLEQFEFEEVLNDLQIFLQEITDNLINEKSIDKKWDPKEFKWN
jgi:predicted nucleotidyltransferase component of viral defense system